MDDHRVLDVRRADQDDSPVLAGLLWDFNTEFDADTDPVEELTPRFARILGEPGVVALLAEDAGTAVGFCLVTLRPAIWFDGPVAQLEELYVVPDLRDRGTGTALLREACRVAHAQGSPEMQINVDEVDTDTQRFYERHGFVTIEPGAEGRMLCYVGPTRGRTC